MVEVYITDIANLPDPLENPQVMDGLDSTRKEKIMRCKQPETRKQSLGAGLLLRYALERHGIWNPHEEPDEKIQIGVHGKPEIAGIYFNLSHSKDLAVCAVSGKPVGCDVEKIKDAPDKVADKFLAENEKKYLSQFSDAERDKAFYRLWTMKESYVKMTGEGLSIPLDQFELSVGKDIRILRDGLVQNCFLKEYEVLGYALTVCAEESYYSQLIRISM